MDKYNNEWDMMSQRKWSPSLWEQVAHELVWAVGLLEEDPTSPKAWRKMFNVLKTYETIVRNYVV